MKRLILTATMFAALTLSSGAVPLPIDLLDVRDAVADDGDGDGRSRPTLDLNDWIAGTK